MTADGPASLAAAAPPADADSASASGRVSGQIGPNAIIRMAEALHDAAGVGTTERVFAAAGLAGYLDRAPSEMVDEREVSALHAAVMESLGAEAGARVCRSAGAKTADYLLANRIPAAVQRLLRRLPPAIGSRVLLAAVAKNAWTFAGSGAFDTRNGKRPRVRIQGCPFCRDMTAEAPRCDYLAGTFERLYRVLVHSRTEVREIACEAAGDNACVFELHWRD